MLWLAYEEQAGLLAKRLRVRAEDRGIPDAASRIYILNLRGDIKGAWPLFGPGDRNGSSGLYNSRPEPLCGWGAMVGGLRQVFDRMGERPTMIVIDPALSAYVGESNNVPPVREFTGALGALAESEALGILLLAHSTKEGGSRDPFDRQQVGGSPAWTDGVRCCFTLCFGDGSGKPDSEARTLAVLKANTGPSKVWTTVSTMRRVGASSGWIVGYERHGQTEWLERELWLSDAEELKKQREDRRRKVKSAKAKPARSPGGDLFANGGATNGSGQSVKNGGAQNGPQPSADTGDGHEDDSLAVMNPR